ncbi:hypothetical protein CB0940_02238 [Cercospora beticola]|uniref:Uncharacterized protein n=1 Tax=Cercospora beticola TaxID=122368 RepID=A0A2G5I9F2_CERBT|nr:hypothetical protein CB0940_02238 [Cercospora beticola]PIB01342.1 hypothetical protein CB0940_02238 [Cercospora beticola]WPA97602.1 hypothetical protein RHO25_002212 [Cercospora beticola]
MPCLRDFIVLLALGQLGSAGILCKAPPAKYTTCESQGVEWVGCTGGGACATSCFNNPKNDACEAEYFEELCYPDFDTGLEKCDPAGWKASNCYCW